MIGLLRHGEVEGGQCFRGSTNDPVTPFGLDQMRNAISKEQRWDRVITSPLQRCAQFAEAFAQGHSIPFTTDSRLAEIHFGTWEGRTAEDIMLKTPDALTQFWNDPQKHPPPEAERLNHFQDRVLEAWSDITQNLCGQNVLIVSHGGVIRMLLCHIKGHPVKKLMELNVQLGELFRIQIDVHDQKSPQAKLII